MNEQIDRLNAEKAELTKERLMITKMLSLTDDTETYAIQNGHRIRSSELDDKVLETLKDGAKTQVEISRILGVAPSTVYHSLGRLIAKGLVKKDGSKYAIV